MAAESWLDRADWAKRSPDFGRLRAGYAADVPAVLMELRPAQHAETVAWRRLREAWLALPKHPNLLDAVETGNDAALVLRYAAIDWDHLPRYVGPFVYARASLITWGAQILDVFHMMISEEHLDIGLFVRPFVKIDLHNQARIGFLPPVEELPPEKKYDERTLVYCAGKLLEPFCSDESDLASWRTILERCVARKPSHRYRTMFDLKHTWTSVSEAVCAVPRVWLESRDVAEEAVGWLALGDRAMAELRFERAWQLDPDSLVAKAGRERFSSVSPQADPRAPSPRQRPQLEWYAVAGRGVVLQPERELAEAIRARAYLQARKPEDALQCADAWIADSPCAAAHYTRGRALFALSRFGEAREAFERACVLDPTLLEAMLLRREAERAMKKIRATVGVQPKLELELPEHLGELRDALLAGRVEDMISVLARSEYEHDAIAKLFHAQCLMFAKRFDEALAMFDHVVALAPDDRRARLGKALALRELGRADEAERLLEQFPDELAI